LNKPRESELTAVRRYRTQEVVGSSPARHGPSSSHRQLGGGAALCNDEMAVVLAHDGFDIELLCPRLEMNRLSARSIASNSSMVILIRLCKAMLSHPRAKPISETASRIFRRLPFTGCDWLRPPGSTSARYSEPGILMSRRHFPAITGVTRRRHGAGRRRPAPVSRSCCLDQDGGCCTAIASVSAPEQRGLDRSGLLCFATRRAASGRAVARRGRWSSPGA
jgi:hypothetical protein